MSEEVFVKFEYGVRDVAAALLLRARLWARMRLGAVAILVVGAACAVGVVVVGPPWGRQLVFWGLAIALVNAAFSAVWAVPHLMFRKSKADARPTRIVKEEFLTRQMSVDASDDGVVVTHGKRSATIRWSDCVELVSDRWSYILFHGDSGFLVVPRRTFRSPEKDAALSSLAKRLLPRDTAEPEVTTDAS